MAASSAARASTSSPSAWRASATTLHSAAVSGGRPDGRRVERLQGGHAELDDLGVTPGLVEREAPLDDRLRSAAAAAGTRLRLSSDARRT